MKSVGNNGWSYAPYVPAFLIIVFGVILSILGETGLNAITSCPIDGCSAAILWQAYGGYWIESYTGALFNALGIMLVIATSRNKRTPINL